MPQRMSGRVGKPEAERARAARARQMPAAWETMTTEKVEFLWEEKPPEKSAIP